MTQKNTKFSNNEMKSENQKSIRTLETIVDEYKLISIKLSTFSDIVSEDEGEALLMAKEQAKLLDEQQKLIVEANSIELTLEKDACILIDLWCADQVYSEDVTPSQRIVLKVGEFLAK